MGRRRKRRSAPFRAWGLLLTALVAIAAYGQLWTEALILAGMLLGYLGVVRLTRCRVETVRHRPCRWIVRGVLGTCDHHVGYKRGLPRLVRGDGFAAFRPSCGHVTISPVWQRRGPSRSLSRGEP
jgi:hypothetical protein